MNNQSLSIGRTPQDGHSRGADIPSIADGIRLIFQQIFHTEVGNDDGFFDLGGDSLAGETLLAGIERDFGVALPLSILLEIATPRALAETIVAKKKAALPTILFTVSDAGSRTPLFCIHGANGTAAFSRKLRNVLPDRPIYALRALGILPGEVPLISVPEIARSYVHEIRKVRPCGPYHVFGQCVTADLAYEVAQQLSAGGERVATLTLGDPHPLKRRSRIRRFYFRVIGKRAIRAARLFPDMSGDERRQRITDAALMAARKTYDIRPYLGRAMIVAASENAGEILHPKSGYSSLIPQLETVIVDGTHMNVFSGMNADAPGKLAHAMSQFLARHD